MRNNLLLLVAEEPVPSGRRRHKTGMCKMQETLLQFHRFQTPNPVVRVANSTAAVGVICFFVWSWRCAIQSPTESRIAPAPTLAPLPHLDIQRSGALSPGGRFRHCCDKERDWQPCTPSPAVWVSNFRLPSLECLRLDPTSVE